MLYIKKTTIIWLSSTDKKLYFTDAEQKISSGLSAEEFDDMASYLEPFKGQFQRFDYMESLNILLMHIRQGTTYEFLVLLVKKMTGRTLTSDAFSLMMRRVLFILVGPNKDGYNESYHARFSMKPIYRSVGKYFDKYINFHIDTYKKFRSSGASTFAKALSLTTDALTDLIEACDGGDPDDIEKYIEENYVLNDMFVVVDATYVSNYS